jgi:hypothetical protein
MIKELFIYSSASIISSTLTYPGDVLKSQYQLIKNNKLSFNSNLSMTQLSKFVYNKNGMFGFYKGLNIFLTNYPTFWTTFFIIDSKKYNIVENNVYNNIIWTTMCSSAGSFVSNPFFVIKTRMQSQSLENKNVKFIDIIKNIHNNESYLSFFKGYGATLFNNTKLIVQMPLYSFLNEKTENTIVSSFLAKTFSTYISYPLDLIRTIQRNTPNKLSSYMIAKEIWGKNKLIGFYKGSGIYMLTSTPNFVIMMYIIDKLTKKF